MHEYRPTTPRSAVKAANANGSGANGAAGASRNQDHLDDDHDERFPQAEGDAEGGYSYDGPSAATVPLVTRHRPDEDDVVFDGDEEVEHELQQGNKLEVVPYAHRDLKPGLVLSSSLNAL